MPIRPEHRWLYPIDWRELSAMVRFRRARGRCEHCGRPHGQDVQHVGDGRWYDEERRCWRDGRGRRVRVPFPAKRLPEQLRLDGSAGKPALPRTRVVLATAHLDHDPGNNRPRNLAALCQRCHLVHDRPEHRRRRWSTLFRRRALGDLFQGTYR
jgi:ribosomal protein S14